MRSISLTQTVISAIKLKKCDHRYSGQKRDGY